MKLVTVLVAAGLLTGCAMSKEIYLPDGTLGHSISCDGSALSVRHCFEKASQLCGAQGYTVIGQDREGNHYSYGGGSANANSAVVTTQSGMMVTRTLMVRCGQE